MKRQLIAAVLASGCLLGLQASAFAQDGSFAFSGEEAAELNAHYNAPAYGNYQSTPSYWNYVAPNEQPRAATVHHRAARR